MSRYNHANPLHEDVRESGRAIDLAWPDSCYFGTPSSLAKLPNLRVFLHGPRSALMRIGIDTRLAYYQPQGGIAQYTLRLIQAFGRMGAPDEFVVLHNWKDQPSAIVPPLTNAHHKIRTHQLFTPSHHRFEQWTLPPELFLARINLLHSPDFIPPFWRHCPVVITVHDLAFQLYPHLLTHESAAYYGQIERAVQSADHIIAVSEATRRDIVRLLGVSEKKITVIYEAADPIFRPINNPRLIQSVLSKYQLRQPLVLFVGTIEPRKNIPVLLRAFRQLLDHYKVKAQLVLAGRRGWLADSVFALMKELELGEDVKYLGPVPATELVALYNAAQLFVMPSLYEGFGLPPLEAMACGTPVIVSRGSSLPEVVGDAGLHVNPKDQSELAVLMRRVLEDRKLRRELRQAGIRRAQMFSWDRAARETLDVYHQVARR